MKLLVDMNLSPRWVRAFAGAGFEALHWSTVGPPDAPDEDIMQYAMQHGFIVFTNDLDFGALLALSRQAKPSVIQVRTKDVLPAAIARMVFAVLRRFSTELDDGAILTVEAARPRVRILPIR